METVAYLLLGLAVIGALIYAFYQVNRRQQRVMAELTRLERLTAEVAMNAEAVFDEVDQRLERLRQMAAELEERAARQLQAGPRPQSSSAVPAQGGAGPQSGTDAEAGTPEQPRYPVPPPAQVQPGARIQPEKPPVHPQSAVRAYEALQRLAQPELRPPGDARTPMVSQSPEATARHAPADGKGPVPSAPEAAGSAEPPQPEEPEEMAAAVPLQQAASPADRYEALRQEAWRLADEGKDAVEIAGALGVPRGEVLLMLKLRGRRAPR